MTFLLSTVRMEGKAYFAQGSILCRKVNDIISIQGMDNILKAMC